MGNKYLLILFTLLLPCLTGCEDKDGGWSPFKWEVESISSPEDISISIQDNFYVRVQTSTSNGKIVMNVSNYTPWLPRVAGEMNADKEDISQPLHSRTYPWGTINIEGHTVTLEFTNLTDDYIGKNIKIELEDGDAFSELIIVRR